MMTDFCSVSDVEAYLGLELAGNDAQVLQAIRDASAVIRNYCKQEISKVEEASEMFDGGLGDKLFLEQLPVLEIVRIEEDGRLLVEDQDYKLGNNGIVYRVWRNWANGIRNIKVVYSHGYEEVPDDVRGVCVRSVARLYQAQLKAKTTDGMAGVTGVTVGNLSMSFEGEGSGGSEGNSKGITAARTLLASEKEILNRYRLQRQP